MIKIISVGKKHEDIYSSAIAHFEKRLSAWQKVEWLLLTQSGLEKDAARSDESTRILEKLHTDDYVLLLDEKGQNLSSPEIANHIEKAQNTSRNIVCIIGGAYGVTQSLQDRANGVIAFGSAVFPHQLMRVMLLEQLYRAYSINAGSSYHHL